MLHGFSPENESIYILKRIWYRNYVVSEWKTLKWNNSLFIWWQLKQITFDFNSADIPRASGCLISPDLIRTAQLVQQPATKHIFRTWHVEIKRNQKMALLQEVSVEWRAGENVGFYFFHVTDLYLVVNHSDISVFNKAWPWICSYTLWHGTWCRQIIEMYWNSKV